MYFKLMRIFTINKISHLTYTFRFLLNVHKTSKRNHDKFNEYLFYRFRDIFKINEFLNELSHLSAAVKRNKDLP